MKDTKQLEAMEQGQQRGYDQEDVLTKGHDNDQTHIFSSSNNSNNNNNDTNNNNSSSNNEARKTPHNLQPPPSCGETIRDAILRTLDRPCSQYLGIAVLVGVVASGALFFFFLMGWQTLCRPRTDCQPRNDIYNISIQILNVFFTYMAVVSLPWRFANFLHTVGASCPWRSNAPGHDLYGQETDDVWFHIPLRPRTTILLFLLLNCWTQLANQATRIIYYNYELQNESPGNIWTNVFFGASMMCAAVGGALLAYSTGKVRATDPSRFGPGPIETVRRLWQKMTQTKESTRTTTTTTRTPLDQEDDSAVTAGLPSPPSTQPPNTNHTDSQQLATYDPTRDSLRRSVLGNPRSSMRMFAM